MNQQALLAAIPGLSSRCIDARSRAILCLLGAQVPSGAALLTYIDKATGSHRVLANEGYRDSTASYLVSDSFIESDPGFRTVSANPERLMSWDDFPQYRDTFSPREVYNPAGFYEGISMILTDPRGRTVGTLHLSTPEPVFSKQWKSMMVALRPVVTEMAEMANERSGLDLTIRELEILKHIVSGKSNPKIAEELFLSRRTVSTHVEHILRKLGASNRVDAVVHALRLGM
jgi:DNA-binding CsgD family transcriptional regulator